jgi:hypothetical protein
MKIEKLKPGDLRYKEGMRYRADFSGFILHFTEKSLDELGRKITTLQNTSIKSACVNAVNSWCLLHSKETAPESLIQAIRECFETIEHHIIPAKPQRQTQQLTRRQR